MDQDRTENFASPLDEVLEGIPQEDPPEGLARRCLDGLDEAAAKQRPAHPRWYAPLRNVVAVAAGLLLIVGTANLITNTGGVREQARQTSALSAAKPLSDAVAEGRAAEMPGEPMAETHVQAEAESMATGMPAQPGPAAREPMPAPAAPRGAGAQFGDELAMMPEPGPPPAEEAEEAVAHVIDAAAAPVAAAAAYGVEAEREPAMRAFTTSLPPSEQAQPRAGGLVSPPVVTHATQPRTPDVEDPWRDFSGDRQVISTKDMELEVSDVERAYDEARAIVEKHGGFVASDRIAIDDSERDVAHLTIRLPVGSFESAITDLRQLGDVVRLVGESVDVTQEYYAEGAEVREMADREQWLVDRYEAETNAQKKRELKRQLDALREEMRREKEILTSLAEQTHWPVLELVLSESTGPGDFASRMFGGSLSALAWVGATAIIWVPIVVLLTLFWRRIVPSAPRSE